MAALSDHASGAKRSWSWLSLHGLVLLCVARDQALRLRDIAVAVGVTERAVQNVIGDLRRSGALAVVRVGRRNRYVLRQPLPITHPIEIEARLGDFIDSLSCAVGDGASAQEIRSP